MYNGILPVFKERGLTSHDVVFKLRKILKMKKATSEIKQIVKNWKKKRRLIKFATLKKCISK